MWLALASRERVMCLCLAMALPLSLAARASTKVHCNFDPFHSYICETVPTPPSMLMTLCSSDMADRSEDNRPRVVAVHGGAGFHAQSYDAEVKRVLRS